MVPRTSYPPTHKYTALTKSLTPTEAQSQLAEFLSKTSTHPHLHPDSLLSTTGITYSAHSGPSGGLALHHLRRIEAGLRGEDLVVETEEELKALTGEDDGKQGDGDDAALDESIVRSEGRLQRKEGKKRKRVEEIRDWAEDTSSQAGDFSITAPGREIESFAHTPLHQSDYDGRAAEGAEQDWQDQEDFNLRQQPLEGELGERAGAPVQSQNRGVPGLVEHHEDGGVKGSGKQGKDLSAEEKRARKAAKKAKKARWREEKD